RREGCLPSRACNPHSFVACRASFIKALPMYLIQGPPTVYRLTQPSPAEGEAVLSVAINPAGSLIAVVSTHRLSVWSGGSKHVVLGSEPIGLSCLAGVSALWKRDSSVLAAITKRGRLL
ncbi:unnamed protein product, partial [Chrysoparadoxa australica]